MTDVFFLVFSVAAVVSGLFVVTSKNPIHSALSLLAMMISLSLVFLQLAAPFLAIMQILVYAGAVVVLFVFVIMLLNLDPAEMGEEKGWLYKVFSAVMAFCLAAFIGAGIWNSLGTKTTGPKFDFGFPRIEKSEKIPKPAGKPLVAGYDSREHRVSPDFGSATAMGRVLFSPYILPFELISVLIVAAVGGAVILAKRKV